MATVIGDNGVDVSNIAGSKFLFKHPYIVFIARENYLDYGLISWSSFFV
jgi:hypothetical protein